VKPKVSVIVLNYNGRSKLSSLLDECINSIINQTYENIEVLFVDNGSTDDSYVYIKARYGDKVKVVRFDRNYGFSLGNNLATKFASKDSKYLLFLNPDAVLDFDYIEVIVNFLEENKEVGVAQGLQVFMEGSLISLGGYVDSYGRGVELIFNSFVPRHPVIVLWASGSAMVVRRKVFEELGGFSPELFLYHDEIDLCSRVWSKGYAVVAVPFTRYRHLRGGVARSVDWIAWYFANRNRWLTTIRYLPLRRVLVSLLVALPIELLINVVKSVKKRERPRASLYARILVFLARKLSSNLRRRIGDTSSLAKFVINVRSPLSKESEAIARIPQVISGLLWRSTRPDNVV
jgi:GT2 family glycosyltransferase